MKVPLSWLKEYINGLSHSVEKISETLTLAGLEVEGVETMGSGFSGVVVAKVLSVAPHPNADKLCVAMVSDGAEELQIVCAAKNCRAGLLTALAKIGATLTDKDNKSFKIKKGKLRDVESFGMLCAADELGLPQEGEGILELSEDTVLGTDVSSLFSDTIFDVSLTPNLGHCMSMVGMARELAALLQLPLKKPSSQIREDAASSIETSLQVEILDKEHCLRYCARMLRGIKVGSSPAWLKNRLESCGLRSINNVVDISNYIMLELGQPLHIFDYDKIANGQILVASNTSFSFLKTLDKEERKIPSSALLICDKTKPLAIAGIMGGEESAVSEDTHTIVIEAAWFDPSSIRKTSKVLSLKSDSSQRFEKGIDPSALLGALDRAADLVQQVAGGQVIQGIIDRNIHPYIARKITCRLGRVNQLLGTELSLREVADIFERLEIKIVKEHQSSLEALIPSFRNDLQTEIDLIEEVARLYGYNNIPKQAPLHVSSPLTDAPIYLFENAVRDKLMNEGLQELITCDLISPALAELSIEPGAKNISLLTVLQSKSSDYSVLRDTLLPGLLQSIKYNYDHQNKDICGFEIGRVHYKEADHFKEQSCAGLVLTGKATPHHYDPKPRDIDFFDLKGIIENILTTLNIPACTFEISHLHSFQPGRQARIKAGDITIGVLGEVHPSTLQKLDVGQRVFFAEINLHELFAAQKSDIQVKKLPQFPGSERDWTLTVKKEVLVGELLKTIQDLASPVLEKIFVLDLYQSDKLGKDRKNITLRFVYRDLEKTLSFEAIEIEHVKLTQKVAEKLQDCILLQ